MTLLRSEAPVELGAHGDVDPHAVEPGVILWERFCVVGPTRHAQQGWRVAVTDVRREMGVSPHHRLEAQVLQAGPGARERIRRAALAEQELQPVVRAVVEVEHGIALLFDPVSTRPAFEIVDQSDAERAALALTRALAHLHRNGVHGVEFRREDLRRRGRDIVVAGFDHLQCVTGPDRDLERLCDLLSGLGGARVGALCQPAPTSARELAQRASSLLGPLPTAESGLPAEFPFIGRGAQLDRLEATRVDATIARARVVLIRGERGVGKSRVLDTFLEQVQAAGESVLVADQGADQGGPRARAGITGALERLSVAASALSSAQREAMRKRIRARISPFEAVLSRYAPRLADLVGCGQDLPPVELEEAFVRDICVIADALRAVGTQARPLVLAFEELESADAATLAVIERLAREDRTHHTLVVATVRGDMPSQLTEAVVEIVDVDPLAAEGVEELVRASLSGKIDQPRAVVDALTRATAGYPLALWVQLGEWLASGQLQRDEADTWHLHAAPPTAPLIELIDHRLAGLDEQTRRVAVFAAVAGSLIDATWLSNVTGDDVQPAIDALMRAGIAVQSRVGESRFAHTSMRERILEGADVGQRRRAHRALADALEVAGATQAAIAHHREHGLGEEHPRDAHLGSLHLHAGREHLDVYDLDRAAWHFERALACDLLAGARVAALQGSADALVLAGNTARAAAGYIEALDAAEDPVFAVQLGAKALHALYVRGDPDASLAVAKVALAHAGHKLPKGSVVSIAGSLAGAVFGGVKESDELRDALCRLYFLLIAVLVVRDKPAIFALTARAYRIAKELDTPAGATILAMHGAALSAMGRIEAAERIYERAQSIADRGGDDWRAGMVRNLRAQMVTLPRGEYRQGQRQLDEAVVRFRRTGDVAPAALALVFKAAYGVNREPASVLLGWLDEAISMGGRHGLQIGVPNGRALRLLLLARCECDGVVAQIRELFLEVERCAGLEADEILARSYLIMAAEAVGEIDLAATQARALAPRAKDLNRMPEVFQAVNVAIATALSARPLAGRTDRALLARAMRRLEAAGKRSPRLAAAHAHLCFRMARVGGDGDAARRHAETVIGTAAGHGEMFLALDVLRGLAELEQASDPGLAVQHARDVRALSAKLGLLSQVGGAAEVEGEPGMSVEVGDHGGDWASVDECVTNVVSALREHLAVAVEVRVHGLELRCATTELRSLLTALLLAARDTRSTVRDVTLTVSMDSGESSGAVLEVRARGDRSGGRLIAGLSACRQIAARMGTTIDVRVDEFEARIAAHVPSRFNDVDQARPTRGERAVIVHPDVMVRRTLVATLSLAGIECQEFRPDDSLASSVDDADIVFASAAHLPASSSGRHVVEILKRGERQVGTGPVLKIPLLVDDLEAVLAGFRAGDSQTELGG